MQTKNTSLKVKGIDLKNRIVEGYFASFDTIDSDNDVFVKGAFAKSISENGPKGTGRIKHLYNHWDTVGVLQELVEDNNGLRYVSRIGTHSLGEDVLKMVNDGIITEHSVGFELLPDKVEVVNGVRYIKEVKLWEGSSLDKWGANANTPIIKSATERDELVKRIAEHMVKLQKAMTDRTTYSDDGYMLLQIRINTLNEWVKSLIAVEPPSNGTQMVNEPIATNEKGIDINKLITYWRK